MKPLQTIAFTICLLFFDGCCVFVAKPLFTSPHHWAFTVGCGMVIVFLLVNIECLIEFVKHLKK